MNKSHNLFQPKYSQYDRERSEKLVEASGFDWEFTVFSGDLLIVRPDGAVIGEGTLYEPDNMALAWILHTAMLDVELTERESPYVDWWKATTPWMKLPAQRLWLDKILELQKG